MKRPLISVLLIGIIVSATISCREEGSEMYLDGKRLLAPLEVIELQGGVVGFTGTYYAIEPDGAWASGPILPGSSQKGPPTAQGALSKEQLAQLSERLSRHQLATLTDYGSTSVNPRVLKIRFGKEIRVLNPSPGEASPAEDQQIRSRYDGILGAVKALCADAGSSP